MAAATDAGMEPRCTGMCSAWARSSPDAVNSAAEQSARSLMLGLKAARRSTAPISSAIDASLRREDLQLGGVHVRTTTHAPVGPGSARQPSGIHTVQSDSATTWGPTTGARRDGREVTDRQGRGAGDTRTQCHDLDRRPRVIEAVAASMFRGEVGRGHPR